MSVKLQNATDGKVKFCLYPGTLAKPLGDPACLKSAGSTLTGHAKSKKPFTWTVTLIGAKAGTTPMTDLRIDWRASQPRLEIIDLRLQGKGSKPYNGVVVDWAADRALVRSTSPPHGATRWVGIRILTRR